MNSKQFKGYTLNNSLLFYSKYFPLVHGTDFTTALSSASKEGKITLELATDMFVAMALAGTKELRRKAEEEGIVQVKEDLLAGIGIDEALELTKAVTEVLGEKKQ